MTEERKEQMRKASHAKYRTRRIKCECGQGYKTARHLGCEKCNAAFSAYETERMHRERNDDGRLKDESTSKKYIELFTAVTRGLRNGMTI